MLDWPSAPLLSNARVHWAKKKEAKAAYRAQAKRKAIEVGADRLNLIRPALSFRWVPPDNKRRDAHNMAEPMKPAIDGVADALGQDDIGFHVTYPPFLDEVQPGTGGAVFISIGEAPA